MDKIRIEELIDPLKAEQHLPHIKTFFAEGGTWQLLLRIPDHQLEEHYDYAYTHLANDAFDEAAEAFKVLTLLNPYEAKYWFGLGLALEESGSIEGAQEAYQLAIAIEETEPVYRLHAARCLIHLGLIEEAQNLLIEAEQFDKIGLHAHEIEQLRKEIA